MAAVTTTIARTLLTCLLGCALVSSCIESSGPPAELPDAASTMTIGGEEITLDVVAVQTAPDGGEIARGRKVLVTGSSPDGDGVSLTLRELESGEVTLDWFSGDSGLLRYRDVDYLLRADGVVDVGGGETGDAFEVVLTAVSAESACGTTVQVEEIVLAGLLEATADEVLAADVADETGYLEARFSDGTATVDYLGAAATIARSNSAGHPSFDVESNSECFDDDDEVWAFALSFDRQTLGAGSYVLTVQSTIDQIPLVGMRRITRANQIVKSFIAISGTLVLDVAAGGDEPVLTGTLEDVTVQEHTPQGALVADSYVQIGRGSFRLVKP